MEKTDIQYCRHSGFSLVELIIVIVVLAILAAVIIPRFVAPSAFNAIGARDAIIAVGATAQQLSLGRNNVTLEIDAAGNDWVISAREAGNVIADSTFAGSNIILETGSTANLGSCSSAYNDPLTSSFAVIYDRSGNASAFTNGGPAAPVQNGVRLCINNNPDFSVCISPAGYAYAGDCDD